MLLNPNGLVNKSSILLEEIKESIESSASYYSEISESQTSYWEELEQEVEEIKREESMTLN